MADGNKMEVPVFWRYHAGPGSEIWQMMFTGSGCLAGQKRFPESRKMLFFSIDTMSGKMLADNYELLDPPSSMPVGDGWFAGFESADEKLVFCHAYQSDSPEHRGIWALDPADGTVVWARPDIVFSANLENELLAYRSSVFAGFPERHFFLVDPGTGSIRSDLGIENAEINLLRQNAKPEEVRQQVILPDFADEKKSVELSRLARLGSSGPLLCEYIEIDEMKVIALHDQTVMKGYWNSSIRLCLDGHAVYADTMVENTDRPAVNNFLIRGDKLYYIKEKEELVCVSLP